MLFFSDSIYKVLHNNNKKKKASACKAFTDKTNLGFLTEWKSNFSFTYAKKSIVIARFGN